MKQWAALAAAAVAFFVLVTANSGGYRFGVSDQAYYEPAIAKGLDAQLFPRDSALLNVQSKYLGSVHLLAFVTALTGTNPPTVFLVTYVITVCGLFAASVVLARRLGMSWWACATFLLLLALRHRIAKTAANTMEGYMHPRMLAFVCGIAACAALAGGRALWAAVWTLVAIAMHPTTGLWFGILVAVALTTGRVRLTGRHVRVVVLGAVVAVLLGWGLATFGPLAGRLVIMDRDWLDVLEEKDYLFPAAWPAYAWIVNLSYSLLLWLAFRSRQRRGVALPVETGLVAGVLALVVLFLVSVPFTMAKVALAVQLQINRIFWVADFFTSAYVAWWLVDRSASVRLRLAIVSVLTVAACVRGAYILRVESDRMLIQATLPKSDWISALSWLESQPKDWFVLADPGQAWKFGASVRVGAHRDTLLEAGKDSSMAMYDRDVAMHVKDRTEALANFEALDTDGIRSLAARYHLTVLVDKRGRTLALPVLYENAGFVVYDLR